MSQATLDTETATWLSMNKHLHIVSFNVPLPADYGGVIDVFYRLKALSEAGVRIHLHCFTYGRPAVPELERYCEEVHYYRRDTSPLRMLGRRPYIVASRSNDELCQRLRLDNYPILLEGIHCCDILDRVEFLERKVMVRAHNVEADYYRLLSRAEHSLMRKLYLKDEARKLRRYECGVLARASAIFTISQQDAQRFEAMGLHSLVVGASHPFSEVTSLTGRGAYALFHGNLAVAENYRAVEHLAGTLFAEGQVPFVVAGNNPPRWLRDKLSRRPNITLVDSPNDETMQRLISEAQVILLHTEQSTGLKIKLLHSLFAGRHCMVNSAMVTGTGLASLCVVADSVEEQKKALESLMQRDFLPEQVEARRVALEPYLTKNAVKPILEELS